jgi:hypothetical protein
MTSAQLAERLLALEKRVEELQAALKRRPDPMRPWWRDDAGRFADDPVFDQIVRLGRAYRRSQRPGSKRR